MEGDQHRRVLQHIRDDEKPDHAASYVDLIQLRYAAIATGDGDFFKGDVEVILSYFGWTGVEIGVLISFFLPVEGNVVYVPSASFPR